MSGWQDDLQRLQRDFQAGYPGYVSLHHALMYDTPLDPADCPWRSILSQPASPWRTCGWRMMPEDIGCAWCFYTVKPGEDMAPVERHFLQLAFAAAQILDEAGRLAVNINHAPDNWGLGKFWVDEVYRLAWQGRHRLLHAPRYRLHQHYQEPDTHLRVDYFDEMASHPTMLRPTRRRSDLFPVKQGTEDYVIEEARCDDRAPLLFPHRFFSVLIPDVFRASMYAIDVLLAPGEPLAQDRVPDNQTLPWKKPKRSTQKGDAQTKIIAALTEHHRYANDSCLNLEPIGNNELARKAEVSPSTVSAFFKKQFKEHAKYRAVCRDPSKLVAALKLFRGEYSPHILYEGSPPREGERDDE